MLLPTVNKEFPPASSLPLKKRSRNPLLTPSLPAQNLKKHIKRKVFSLFSAATEAG